MKTINLIGDIRLRRVDAITYLIINTTLIIRRMDKQFSGETKDTWDLASAFDGMVIVESLNTLIEAKNTAKKLIIEAIEKEIKRSYI